ncbi:efflux transporter outer membrane subunit [Caulobacter sp. RL271]|jgi:multidrug efflux system outer membrane protein|uniref:Efflux transporter outer membrane subunit n=1 Tax=Caulobacter segnis TaxID=88688 RepID=A0ABY4ZS13_9CAUL|nr:efflux transporter outer membrane subunit [Caulobacter segnis]USQ95587.1 efflux transporter outer membrane subunit [Caulobacter segnis]
MRVFANTLRAALIAGVSLTAAACAVGPNYKAPATPPAAFQNADPAVFTAANPEAEWWKAFGDPVLDQLVGQALSANLDLKIAVARVGEARALFTEQKLDLLPHVTADGTYTKSKAQQPGVTTERVEGQSYQAGFDAGWEIDLFGRVRRGVEAAGAEAGAAQAELRDAQVTVAAEVARNYLELRGAQARLNVATRNLETQRETVRLTKVRFDAGAGSPIDVASAQARLNATEAAIPGLITAEKRANYRLAVLTGQRPGALDALLVQRETDVRPLVAALPIGDAGDLLRRRPDVQAAERRLAASTARVGVATADLFPRVSVTGFVGFLSGTSAGFGNAASQAWSVAPSVSWPALDLGSAHARLRAAKARDDAALANYDQTVLRALEDLENALVSYRQQQAQLKSLTDQAAASRRAAELARIQYKEGGIDFLVLLDAERTLLAAEDALSVAETGVNTDVVAIYKALGGGWKA